MSDKPIIFMADSIAAIRNRRKTQTRRVIVPQPSLGGSTHRLVFELDPWHADAFVGTPAEGMFRADEPRRKKWLAEDWCGNIIGVVGDAPYAVGDRLWVKEWWTPAHGEPRWGSPLFMPKARASLWLLVTGLRAEHLLDISAEDVAAEGYSSLGDFLAVWDALNAKRGYGVAMNPWVWVYTFEEVRL